MAVMGVIGDGGMSPRSFIRSLAIMACAMCPVAPAGGARAATDTDSLYFAVHPRLAFTKSEIPSIRAKLNDGGVDDNVYAIIRDRVAHQYPSQSLQELMELGYGLNVPLNIGFVSYFQDPADEAAKTLARRVTLELADNLGPDDDTFFASIRLRSLCYGYDLCLERATTEERARVREEIESYVDTMMVALNFERWLYPPYTSNISAMIGSSLGIAAICLANEMEPARVAAVLARADAFVDAWIRQHLDPDGTCFEGVQYGTWAMRHLAWYFEARRRYDGVDYSQRDDIRRIERWLAYEVLPERGGVVNNLNDTAYLNHPIARHNTYLEWALSRWNSGLASWLWDRSLGFEDGYDWGPLEDEPATALWHRSIAPVNPATLLPRAFLWEQRGLYYYRTGWPSHGSSDDLVFSFYSGVFNGGHSQEDQNSFTLYAYGSRFACDNGFDRQNQLSAAHNMIFIDGNGQHHSGSSVGTDGRIAKHLLTPYADYLFGDATAAYSTHSPYNNPGVPFPDDDWSYGYLHANPVERAYREWLVIHGEGTPPYFVLVDDIKKDDVSREYQWRMHTDATLSADVYSTPIRISGPRGALEIDVCHPADDALARGLVPFDNTSVDPNTQIVTLTTQGTSAFFSLVLRPLEATPFLGGPVSHSTSYSWGGTTVLEWPDETTDVILTHAGTDTVEASVLAGGITLPLRTDARILHLRRNPRGFDRCVMIRATVCDAGSTEWLRVRNGSANVVVSGWNAYLDRADVSMRLFAPQVRALHAGDASLTFARDGGYISTPLAKPPSATPALRVYPQPARGAATIVLENRRAETMTVEVFDVSGRRVRSLWHGVTAPGTLSIAFDGNDDLARPLASGAYFLRATGGDRITTTKFVLVR